MQFWYNDNVDLTDKKDSLQLDSGTVIATLCQDGYLVSLEVRGEVRVTFDGVTYRVPSEFPQKLKDIISSGKVWKDERVYIGNNNWFEVFVESRDGSDVLDWTSDTVDVEGYSVSKVLELLIETLDAVKVELSCDKDNENKIAC